MNRYQSIKRRLWTTRDFKERLKLMYLVRGLAWQMEQEKRRMEASA